LPDNPALPDELHDRAQDNWRLLIAIADTLSPAVGERARRAASSAWTGCLLRVNIPGCRRP
jgi:hypothetical protein